MQEDEFGRMWVCSLITCSNPWQEVNASMLVPAVVVISPDHQVVDLTLESPTITAKSDLFLVIVASKFQIHWGSLESNPDSYWWTIKGSKKSSFVLDWYFTNKALR